MTVHQWCFYRLRMFLVFLAFPVNFLLLTNRFHNTFSSVCSVFCKILSNHLNILLSAKETFFLLFLYIANLHQSVLCTYVFLLRIFFLTEIITILMNASLSFLLIYNVLLFSISFLFSSVFLIILLYPFQFDLFPVIICILLFVFILSFSGLFFIWTDFLFICFRNVGWNKFFDVYLVFNL